MMEFSFKLGKAAAQSEPIAPPSSRAPVSPEAITTAAAISKAMPNWILKEQSKGSIAAVRNAGYGDTGGAGRLSFSQLRELADQADLLRMAIEAVKNSVRAQDWSLKSTDQREVPPEATKRMEKPDGESDWDVFSAMVIEEVLVTDNLHLFPWWKGGKAERFEVIDGDTITPKPDQAGRFPVPPGIAFQQIGATGQKNFTTDQLWYLPQGKRIKTVRGYSAVERVVNRATINMTKTIKDLRRWLQGGHPGALVFAPDGMTSTEAEAWQKVMDDAARDQVFENRVKIMPPGAKAIQLQPPKFDKEHEEILIRVIYANFGVDPTSLISQVNYSTANALERWAALQGLRPWLWTLQSMSNRMLEAAGWPWVKFEWNAARDAATAMEKEAITKDFRSGLVSWEDAREKLGLAKDSGDGGEEADLKDKHFFTEGALSPFDPLKPTTPPPPPPGSGLPPNAGGPLPTAMLAMQEKVKASPGATETPEPQGALKKTLGLRKVSCTCGHITKGFGTQIYAPAFYIEAETLEMRRWEAVAKKAIKAGDAPREFKSDIIPPWKRAILQKSLSVPELGLSVFKKGGLRKALGILGAEIGVKNSPRAKAHEEEGTAVLVEILGPLMATAKSAAMQEVRQAVLLSKSLWEIGDVPPPSVDTWKRLLAWLQESYQIGIDDTARVLGQGVDAAQAFAYAQDRAATLLGRWWNAETASWVDNPSSAWSIEGTVRDQANSLVQDAIKNEWTEGQLQDALGQLFDVGATGIDYRAGMIARTELGFAYNTGAAMNYGAMGVEYVMISDNGSPTSCEECTKANGEVWTLAEFLENPLEHPNCVRVGMPAEESEYKGNADES